jgi:hypothetical protein
MGKKVKSRWWWWEGRKSRLWVGDFLFEEVQEDGKVAR